MPLTKIKLNEMTTGTLPDSQIPDDITITGSQTGITQTGTLTSFTSTGIDDNATSNRITLTDNGLTLKSASYQILELQMDSDDSGSNDDAIIKFSTGSAGTLKAEVRYDESSDTFEINRSDNGNDFVLNSSGNVGIGTSPSNALDIERTSGNAVIRATATGSGQGARLFLRSHNTDSTYVSFNDSDDNTTLAVVRAYGTAHATTANRQALAFETAGSERMRIDSSGNVIMQAGKKLYLDGGSNTYIYETSDNVIQFVTNNNTAGPWISSDGIYIGANNGDNQIRGNSTGAGSATLYIGNQSITTSSDIRIKENIVDTEVDALSKIGELRVVDFTWNDPSDQSYNNRNARGKWTGLIAQEVIEHVPYVVNAVRDEDTLEPIPDAKSETIYYEEGDSELREYQPAVEYQEAVYEEVEGEQVLISEEIQAKDEVLAIEVGDVKYQGGKDRLWGMEYDKLVPILIKAIQELSAKVEALENA